MSTQSVHVSVDQAAQAANVSTKTIRRWIGSGRLPAHRQDDGVYQIDQADLERAARGETTAGLAANGTASSPQTERALAPRMPDLAAALSQAIGEAVTTPLYDRLERQATEIGELRAQLAAATAPKPPRAPRSPRGPARPRVSVPADDAEEALRRLAKHFDPAELARVARRLNR